MLFLQYPGTNKDLKMLTGHSDKVCVAKWIKTRDGKCDNEIISASKDCTAIVWTLEKDSYKATVLKGHTDGVNQADSVYIDREKGSLLIVTGSIDSTLKVWLRTTREGTFYSVVIYFIYK